MVSRGFSLTSWGIVSISVTTMAQSLIFCIAVEVLTIKGLMVNTRRADFCLLLAGHAPKRGCVQL